jgi:hypothetical protein
MLSSVGINVSAYIYTRSIHNHIAYVKKVKMDSCI